MTTREQLGLNANWIPMDSSTGSSDSLQGQIDSLKQIVKGNSDKLNELSSVGTSESFLDYTEDKADIKFEILSSNDGGRKLVISTSSSGVDFKFNLSYESTTNNVLLNHETPFELKLPEVIVESLKEFNAHLYRRTVRVSDLKMKKTKTFDGVRISAVTQNVGLRALSRGEYDIDFNALSGENTLLSLGSSFNLYLFCLECGGKENKSISTSSQTKLNNLVDYIKQVYDDQYRLPDKSGSKQIIAIKTLNNNNESSVSAFSDYLNDNGLKTKSGVKSFKILEFNQVFDSNESGMFNVHNFNIVVKTLDDIINPVLVSEKSMRRYGVRLDQAGHPVYAYGRTYSYADTIVYAYFTDLSKWLLYSYHDGGGFMSNVSRLAARHKEERPRSYIMGDGIISDHEYTANISSTGDIANRSLYFNEEAVGENPRMPVGATLEELKSGKIIECYVLNFNSELKSKLENSGIYSLYNMLEYYVDSNTGEYKPSTRFNDDVKQAKVCIKQTIKWDNDAQKVVATGSKVTLRDMFVNFVDKSSKYLAKYPNEGDISYDDNLSTLKMNLNQISSEINRLNLDSKLSTLNRMKSSLDTIVNDSSFDSKSNKANYLRSNGISNNPGIDLDTYNVFLGIRSVPEKYNKLRNYRFTAHREVTISNSTTRADLRRYLSSVDEAINIVNLMKEYATEFDVDNTLEDLNCY